MYCINIVLHIHYERGGTHWWWFKRKYYKIIKKNLSSHTWHFLNFCLCFIFLKRWRSSRRNFSVLLQLFWRMQPRVVRTFLKATSDDNASMDMTWTKISILKRCTKKFILERQGRTDFLEFKGNTREKWPKNDFKSKYRFQTKWNCTGCYFGRSETQIFHFHEIFLFFFIIYVIMKTFWLYIRLKSHFVKLIRNCFVLIYCFHFFSR